MGPKLGLLEIIGNVPFHCFLTLSMEYGSMEYGKVSIDRILLNFSLPGKTITKSTKHYNPKHRSNNFLQFVVGELNILVASNSLRVPMCVSRIFLGKP